MNNAQKSVKYFHKLMDHPRPDAPTVQDEDVLKLRARLILEEAFEFAQAAGFHVNVFKHVNEEDHYASFHKEEEPNMVEMLDALCDILVVTYGAAVALGVDIEPFFKEVMRTNLAKVGPDGVCVRREDGKVLKPEGWKPPDIAGVLAKAEEYAAWAKKQERLQL